MSFSSIASMLSAAQTSGRPLYAVIRDADCQENGYDAAASRRQIAALWEAMQQSSRQYCASDRSNSGLIGGDADRLRAAAASGRLLGGTYFQRVTEEALKVAECNACMKRIVAAPTAGSCGVLPAVLIPLTEERDIAEETILQALYIAAGFGQVTALRASVAGAEGGCQAEIGTASAMAAASPPRRPASRWRSRSPVPIPECDPKNLFRRPQRGSGAGFCTKRLDRRPKSRQCIPDILNGPAQRAERRSHGIQ